MDLKTLLGKKQSSILKKWGDVIFASYPEESQRFLKKQKDRFANPVGCTISEEVAAIFEALLEGTDSDNLSRSLDHIIRIRAVQDFSPSQAVGFIFGLKEVIKEELENELRHNGFSAEWMAFESRIDHLALRSFDIYAACRQQIADTRVNEVKSHTSRLLKMAGLVYEIPDAVPGQEDDLVEAKNE